VLASADWQPREGYLCDLNIEWTAAGTLKAIAQELEARGVGPLQAMTAGRQSKSRDCWPTKLPLVSACGVLANVIHHRIPAVAVLLGACVEGLDVRTVGVSFNGITENLGRVGDGPA
jgi:hypothetical protein